MSVLDIRTFADFRAFLHVVAPGLAALVVGYGVLDSSQAALIVGLVLAVASPAVAALNTADGFRKWFYPVMGAAAAVLIGFGIFAESDVTPWLAFIPVLLGGGVAAANTPTSR
jgi:membrane-bound metal-dependent hydrolase YbcI (DUF457 family)